MGVRWDYGRRDDFFDDDDDRFYGGDDDAESQRDYTAGIVDTANIKRLLLSVN